MLGSEKGQKLSENSNGILISIIFVLLSPVQIKNSIYSLLCNIVT